MATVVKVHRDVNLKKMNLPTGFGKSHGIKIYLVAKRKGILLKSLFKLLKKTKKSQPQIFSTSVISITNQKHYYPLIHIGLALLNMNILNTMILALLNGNKMKYHKKNSLKF